MISNIDILIIVVYLFIMLFLGFIVGKKTKNQEDYFFAGRSMPWIPIALSIAATLFSANGIIGGPGWAYSDGMYPAMVNITVPFAVFISMWITTPVLYNLKVNSVYQFMEMRLGTKSRNLSIVQFLVNSFIQASSMAYIPAMIIQMLTGWSINIIAPIIVMVAVLFALIGGIKSVIWTDTIQMVVIIGGVISIIILAIKGTGLDFSETIILAKEKGKLNTLDFSLDITKENTFWATTFGAVFMWIRYFSFDQSQVQKVLSSKSLNNIKSSLAFSAIVMNVVYFLMLFVGVILFIFYKGKTFEFSNEIILTFIFEELPVGLVGLITAGIIVEAIVSAQSLINSMTSVFTKDIYEYYFKDKKSEASITAARYITVFIGIVMVFFVIMGFSGTTKSLLDVVGNYISYFAGPATGAFILAMFTKKANDKGVSTGFIVGIFSVLIISKTFNTNWLWNPAIGTIVTIIFGYIFSLFTKQDKTEEEINKYTAMGIRKNLIAQNDSKKTSELGLPFYLGKRELGVLIFFIAQYIVLLMIQYL